MRIRLPLFALGALSSLFIAAASACQVDDPAPPASNATAGTPQASASASAAAPATSANAGKQFKQPEQVIQAGKQYTATVKTDKGDIVLALYADKAPVTVNSFVFLAKQGYFDGLTFHRVEPGFVIQGGDPLANGSGGPGYKTQEDQNDLANLKWTVSMAKTAGSTEVGSQFFINLADNTALDQSSGTQKRFFPFAIVTAGQDVVTQIKRGDVVRSVTITEK